MPHYRPSKTSLRTWHAVQDAEDSGRGPGGFTALCGVKLFRTSGVTNPNSVSVLSTIQELCTKCDRIQNPRTAKFNAGEVLMAQHLDELGCAFTEQFHYVPGRLFKADFAIPSIQLLIEINGGRYMAASGHSGPSGIQRDNERGNHAAMNGWRVMRFTPQEVACGAAKEWVRKARSNAKRDGGAW